jgi:hypothetical protein
MKKNYFKNIAGTAIMAGSMILGVSSLTSVQAQYPYQDDRYRQQQQDQYRRAQQQDRWRRDRNQNRRGNYDSYPNWGGYEFRQTALNAGYNEGLKQGRNDRNRRWGGRGDFRNSSAYRNGDRDYNSRFRDRDLYARYFRMAFETGYNDGLNGN